MPVFCEPWPGKRNAILLNGELPDISFVSVPTDHVRTPREPGAKTHRDNHASATNSFLLQGLDQCDSDRCGRRVSILVDIYEHAISRQAHPIGSSIDYPNVSL